MDYLKIDTCLDSLKEPARSACLRLLNENRELLEKAPGSSANHQAWEGGYLDHVAEVMNLAVPLYGTLNGLRPLPFGLSDALIVLFLHDIEKPWKYAGQVEMKTKQDRADFRHKIMEDYDIVLTPEQANALAFVEGENDSYSNKQRAMNELAAFCHMCDIASARIWHDKGKERQWQSCHH